VNAVIGTNMIIDHTQFTHAVDNWLVLLMVLLRWELLLTTVLAEVTQLASSDILITNTKTKMIGLKLYKN